MTKWDELVEVAARASCEIAAKSGAEISHRAWEDAPEHDRQTVREVTGYVMRALLAKGYVIVPGEPTVEMIKAWGDSFWRGDNQGERITAALSAGSIKPEGE